MAAVNTRTRRRKSPPGHRTRRRYKRRAAPAQERVMVALHNQNGIKWVLDYAPVYATILHGIESGLSAAGRQMLVCSIRSADEFSRLVSSSPPDGVLFLAARNVASLGPLLGTIPAVCVLGEPCDGLFDRITYDAAATGRLPVTHFADAGHSVIAILGPTEPGSQSTFGSRYIAFDTAVREAGKTCVPLLSDDLYPPGNLFNQPRPAEIRRLIGEFVRSTPRPSALYVMADNLLPAVCQELVHAGIQPGVDIAIAVCNAENPCATGLVREPAIVEIPSHEIGLRAVEALEWRIHNPDRPTSTLVLAPILRAGGSAHKDGTLA